MAKIGTDYYRTYSLHNARYPRLSTVFYLFELLYESNVRGPLDVLKGTWEADKRSHESVIPYVIMEACKLR